MLLAFLVATPDEREGLRFGDLAKLLGEAFRVVKQIHEARLESAKRVHHDTGAIVQIWAACIRRESLSDDIRNRVSND